MMKRTTLRLPRYGSGTGLIRVERLAHILGVDLAGLGNRAVAITGSNGKGSVARMLAGALQSAGRRTAMFTSPHIIDFNERFEIDGKPVADRDIICAEERVAEAVNKYRSAYPDDAVGEFEAWFLVAAILFSEATIDHLIFEAGIGGRFDPTRLLMAPLCAMVSVDLEHTELLGSTLEEISLDKLDICPPGGRILLGSSVEAVRPALEVAADLKPCTLDWIDQHVVVDRFVDIPVGASFDLCWNGRRFTVASAPHGLTQAHNAALAFGLMQRVCVDLSPGSMEAAFCRGLKSLSNPARLEFFQDEPAVLIDAAHTPAAIENALSDMLHILSGAPAVALVGVSSNKQFEAILGAIAPHFRTFVVGQAYHGLPPNEVAAILQAHRPDGQVVMAASVEEAVELARLSARREGYEFVACLGGLFWAAAVRAVLHGLDPGQLDFS